MYRYGADAADPARALRLFENGTADALKTGTCRTSTAHIARDGFHFPGSMSLPAVPPAIPAMPGPTFRDITARFVGLNAAPFMDGNVRATRIWM